MGSITVVYITQDIACRSRRAVLCIDEATGYQNLPVYKILIGRILGYYTCFTNHTIEDGVVLVIETCLPCLLESWVKAYTSQPRQSAWRCNAASSGHCTTNLPQKDKT